jgi:hypothetical protein
MLMHQSGKRSVEKNNKQIRQGYQIREKVSKLLLNIKIDKLNS